MTQTVTEAAIPTPAIVSLREQYLDPEREARFWDVIIFIIYSYSFPSVSVRGLCGSLGEKYLYLGSYVTYSGN